MSELNKQILFKKFEIISCYKKNEHSAVYLANHIYLEKKVFLKVLNTKTIPDSSITERFKREAKILAQLEHFNIIKVFDFGMFDEFFYISFEYFESKNLREVLNSGKLTEELKRNFLIQLVKGLNFAHQKNVIHRDIKPENILVNEKYELKLTDFGLAQDSIDSLVTQMYAVVGTPAYMSPEQIQGEKLTHKSDLFSLGIIAIELFSGKNPFLGEDSNETINNIISFDEGNVEELFSNLPEDINKIVKGLLAQNPNNRLNSCEDILEILNVEKEDVVVKENDSNKKLWLTIATVGIIFALLIAYYIFKPNNVTK
ncbi:MAG: serine/threonine protein kinase, partial [Ignavibacteriae bacterium]|nr:serine/threonine protein kinase [Ignavibacteriota bacterium]